MCLGFSFRRTALAVSGLSAQHAAALRVNLLDRYIFRSVLLTCLGAVALFAFVLMLGNAIRDLLGYLLRGQL